MNKSPKLSIVGAGPGDPELITVKALKVLQQADVVLYDALVNKELLKHAPNALHMYTGKRSGNHSYTQDEINRLVVSNAKKLGHVVRLKGGDPFVFGRGGEEVDFAKANGIETEIISGITSAIAVPASVGIPLTKRGVSESFWVITGTTSSRKISPDVALAAKSSATVVILMGMNKLSEIVELFQNEGKDKIPVAIIQNGTTENESSVIGTVDSIVEAVEKEGLSSPAIIVIGEVVKDYESIQGELNNVLKEVLVEQ